VVGVHEAGKQEAAGSAIGTTRRVRVGKVLVALAVLAPAVVVVSVYLLLQGKLYGYHVRGPVWPWLTVDGVVLGVGLLLLRGQEGV